MFVIYRMVVTLNICVVEADSVTDGREIIRRIIPMGLEETCDRGQKEKGRGREGEDDGREIVIRRILPLDWKSRQTKEGKRRGRGRGRGRGGGGGGGKTGEHMAG